MSELIFVISMLPLYEHLDIRYIPMDDSHVTETVLEELEEMLDSGTVKNHQFNCSNIALAKRKKLVELLVLTKKKKRKV